MRQKGLLLLVAVLLLACGAAPVFAHQIIYSFPLDEDPGWTATGGWEFGSWDFCGGFRPEVCSAPVGWGPHSGSSMYGHDLGAGLGTQATEETLTTGALDCRGWQHVTLSFWQMAGAPPFTPISVRVSFDGSTWIPVWQSQGFGGADSDWTFSSYDISALADNRPTVYVRWSVGPSTDTCSCYGFDIDDIVISGERIPASDIIYSFPLSYDPGWTMTGRWEWGSATDCCNSAGRTGPNWFKHGSATAPADDSGKYGPGITDTLTTSPIDCTGLTGVHVNFWRQLGLANYYGPDDEASVQVSNDGATWTTAWWTRDHYGDHWTADPHWQYCDYDISAVADNQPTVYVRWVMGPTGDDLCACYGWELDDIEITAKTSQPPLQILAWVPYADQEASYPNTVAALSGSGEPCAITESCALAAETLAWDLEGKQVLLVPEPALGWASELAAYGSLFADVLDDFVYQGGTVVVCGEMDDGVRDHTGFMNATGLMGASFASISSGGEALTTVLPDSALADSLPASFLTSDATASYVLGPESTAVVEDAAGDAVLAYHDYGYGAAVMVGFDYASYDDNAAQALVNAVRYPRWNHEALLYRGGAVTGNSLEALNRLHIKYRLGCGTGEMDCAFTEPTRWNPIVYDSPAQFVTTDGAGIVDYIANGGRAVLSTGNLTAEPDIAAAFGVTAVDHLTSNPPVYRWDPADPVFTGPMTVPDLFAWSNNWAANGDRLSVAADDGVALAGLTESPAADQAAIVRANGGRTIINGFLWDEESTDSDFDGVDDVVELIMDEVTALVRMPEAGFTADYSGAYPPLAVSFTDQSAGVIEERLWDFGDDTTSSAQNPSHTYTAVGSYTVRLTVSNSYGSDTETKPNLIVLIGPTPVAGFSAATTLGYAPLEVAFSDESTGTIDTWAWEFGDGGTSAEQNPTHTYTVGGTYDVSLTVTNTYGSDTETKPDYITVASPIAAAFTVANAAGVVPLTVSFTDTTIGSPEGWSWDFGDGATSTDQNPTHTYETPGYYDVTLTASKGVATDVETKAGCIAAGFADVGPENWAFHSILACATADMVQGYWGNNYRPSEEVNRGQMAVYLARALAGGEEAVPEPTVAAPSFSDVSTEHWAYRYVEYVKGVDVVQGYSGGIYKPDLVVNRGQMAVFIARSVATPTGDAGVPEVPAEATPAFPDVTASNEWAWCYKYVQYIATLDPVVVQGYPNGSYKPELNVTRDQMAVYVQRAFQLPMYLP